jgi:hypothetical protein
MSPVASTAGAVAYARRADVTSALRATTAHADFAAAAAVAEFKEPSEAQYGGPADIAEWRRSSAYIIAMRSTTGALFKPSVPTPRGRSGPSGKVMVVILDSHTGFREGEYIGPKMPTLSRLGVVTNTDVPAEGEPSTAQTASERTRPLGKNVGQLFGRLLAGGSPKAGWAVLIARSAGALVRRAQLVRTTSRAEGRFYARLDSGDYAIAARRPNGMLCGRRSVRVHRHPIQTSVVLRCSS